MKMMVIPTVIGALDRVIESLVHGLGDLEISVQVVTIQIKTVKNHLLMLVRKTLKRE